MSTPCLSPAFIDADGVNTVSVPFTGVFDGNGKTISRFTFGGYEGGFNADTFGFGIFAYIGEGGKVDDHSELTAVKAPPDAFVVT